MDKIGFWSTRDEYGCFSNWWPCNFTYNKQSFISSEQALMYIKATTFSDTEIAKKILQTKNQKEIKALGREVKNYDNIKWSDIRYEVMVDILISKFTQNKNLADILLSTGDSTIYEASPYDRIWGIGSRDVNVINGTNLLGKALMAVREYMRMNNNEI